VNSDKNVHFVAGTAQRCAIRCAVCRLSFPFSRHPVSRKVRRLPVTHAAFAAQMPPPAAYVAIVSFERRKEGDRRGVRQRPPCRHERCYLRVTIQVRQRRAVRRRRSLPTRDTAASTGNQSGRFSCFSAFFRFPFLFLGRCLRDSRATRAVVVLMWPSVAPLYRLPEPSHRIITK